MPSKEKGLYGKFRIERVDGSDREGGKHHGCEYFVLDLTHDPFAIDALKEYASQCLANDYYALAEDLEDMITRAEWTQEQAAIKEGERSLKEIKERHEKAPVGLGGWADDHDEMHKDRAELLRIAEELQQQVERIRSVKQHYVRINGSTISVPIIFVTDLEKAQEGE